jgi:hypothetical protein
MNLSEGMLLTQSDDLDDRLDRARKANAADSIDELRAFAKSDGWSDEELAEAIRTRFPAVLHPPLLLPIVSIH